jgi:negative regulator of flagellin synthesis FlgM
LKIDQKVIPLKNAPATSQGPGRLKATPDTAPATDASGPAPTRMSTPLQMAASGEFDAARVAEIREAIATGRYRMDTGRIASGLLDSVRDFLGASK